MGILAARPAWAALVALAAAGVVAAARPWHSEGAAIPRVSYPPTTQAWSNNEYGIIGAILREGPLEVYPRLGSEQTRAVFLKIIDKGNVAWASQPEAPTLRQLIDLRSYDAHVGVYRSLYNLHARRGEPVGAELVGLQVFLLELSALTVERTEAYAARQSPADLERLRQMAFFDTYGTLRTHLEGVVLSLSERDVYSVGERRQLAEAIIGHFPAMRPIFAATDRRRVASELARLAAAAEAPDLHETLAAAAATVCCSGP